MSSKIYVSLISREEEDWQKKKIDLFWFISILFVLKKAHVMISISDLDQQRKLFPRLSCLFILYWNLL